MAGSVHFAATPLACLLPPTYGPRLHCSAPLGSVPSKLPSHGSMSLHLTAMPKRSSSPFIPRASVDSVECIVEPATNVKFPKEINVPGCTNSLALFGAGYREKVFAIIGVKVYAAGFYAEPSIRDTISSWDGKSSSEILEDSSIFKSIFHAPAEKSLIIMLVRDVDGKTFWNALDDVISPRIASPTTEDQSALSTFQATFQNRDLKQGTYIFLTWVEPSKMLVSISSNGLPSNYDAEIKSANVNVALYDGFFGDRPVSPTLKASVADGLKLVLT